MSVSHTFLVFVPELAVNLQPAFTLFPPPQHLADLQPAIILALRPKFF